MKKYLALLIAPVMFAAACDKDDNGPAFGEQATVSTPADVQNAINDGSREITLTEPLTGEASFVIPGNYPKDTEVSITIPAGGNDVNITEAGFHLRNFPLLSLNVSDAEDVTITTPDLSVIFDGDVAGTLTARTAPTTLTIAPGATVETLVVLEGNVRLLGTVNNIANVAAGSRILYPVATGAELWAKLTAPADNILNGGVVLTADVESILNPITGAQANQDAFRVGTAATVGDSDYDGYIIDGNGFSMSGAAWNNVLAVYADEVIIRDLTVTQTAAQKALPKQGSGTPAINNGITLYRSMGIVLENVTVTNCGKGGIVVNGSEVTAENLTTSGNSWGGVNLTQGGDPANGPAPTFTLVSGSIGETPKIYIDLSDTQFYTVNAPGWTSTTSNGKVIYSPPAN